jgi:hypothetical protein
MLLIKNNQAHDFHAYLNKQDSAWPEDGKNTDYINI